MRVLIISNLYPNRHQPGKSAFNRQQFAALSELCEVRIVSPIPYFQFSTSTVPLEDTIDGIEVSYPRHLVIPRFMQSLYGVLMFVGLYRTVRRILKTFKADVILATWAYPDAFAAALLAKANGLPLVTKTHGTDLNYGLRFRLRRTMIKFAINHSAKAICVSQALRDKLLGLGIKADKIRVLPNGVNAELFHPQDRGEARQSVGIDDQQQHVLFVGNLVPVKGPDLLIRAMSLLPSTVCLHMIGHGSQEADLRIQAESLGIADRIFFRGRIEHKEIPVWQNACDVFCLPSRNEGCPNVVVEALACGTPVVATRVGAVPQLITDVARGTIVPPGDPKALAEGLRNQLQINATDQLAKQPSLRTAILELSWSENARILHADLMDAAAEKGQFPEESLQTGHERTG